MTSGCHPLPLVNHHIPLTTASLSLYHLSPSPYVCLPLPSSSSLSVTRFQPATSTTTEDFLHTRILATMYCSGCHHHHQIVCPVWQKKIIWLQRIVAIAVE